MSVHSHKLPILAQAKLKDFEQRAEELQMLARSTGNRIKGLEAAIEYAPDAPNVADIEHELTRLRSVMAQQQARQSQANALVSRLGGWLRNLSPNTEFVDARPARLAVREGETIVQAIDRIRLEIAALQSELSNVRQAKPTFAELKQKARDYVCDLAKRGAPTITADYAKFEVAFQTNGWSSAAQFDRALAWLDPEKFISRLEQEIDAMPTAAMSLTAKDRADKWAHLTAELAALERSEERLIENAADDGQEIARRIDADPHAVLCVSPKTKVGADAA